MHNQLESVKCILKVVPTHQMRKIESGLEVLIIVVEQFNMQENVIHHVKLMGAIIAVQIVTKNSLKSLL